MCVVSGRGIGVGAVGVRYLVCGSDENAWILLAFGVNSGRLEWGDRLARSELAVCITRNGSERTL